MDIVPITLVTPRLRLGKVGIVQRRVFRLYRRTFRRINILLQNIFHRDPLLSIATEETIGVNADAKTKNKRLNVGWLRNRRIRNPDGNTENPFSEKKPKDHRKYLGGFKSLLRPLMVAGVAGLLLIGFVRVIGGLNASDDSVDKVSVKGLKAAYVVNKEYQIPLKDANGVTVSNVKYVIEKAELRDELIYQGQKATAVAGRTFLLLNLKITNEHNQSININSKDYVRISVNGNENEWLAPDMHNDPVEVQAISTKYSRVGFPINENDSNIVLQFGEIAGEKEKINLEF